MIAATDIAIRTVAILDEVEVYRGQVFHDGHLWKGHSTDGVASYRLDVHDADGTRVKTVPLPMVLQIEQFGGHPGHMYFNETGNRKVFRWTAWGVRPLSPDIHLPGVILPFEKFVFVLERNRIGPGAENIVKIDLATQRIERTFAQTRNKLSTMIDLRGFPWIAAGRGVGSLSPRR